MGEVRLDPHRIGLAMFIRGVLDVVLAEPIPVAWLNLAASPSAEITSFPLLAASPDPAATYLQAVFVGVILVVGGARIYSQRTRAAKGLLLSSLAVLFMLSAIADEQGLLTIAQRLIQGSEIRKGFVFRRKTERYRNITQDRATR